MKADICISDWEQYTAEHKLYLSTPLLPPFERNSNF